MAFGQHLRTNQNTRAAAMHFGQLLFKCPFTAGGIAIDTRQRYAGEERRERLFELLGTQTHRHHMRGAARRALARHRALAVAMVAAQMMLCLVQRVVMIAAWAFCYPASVVAQQRRSESAAVQEQNHLVVGL